jgi:hypothetical protein
MTRFLAILIALSWTAGGFAYAQTAAKPKIAISSLVADTLTVNVYGGATGTNLTNQSEILKMPGPLLDNAVLATARDAIARAAPGAELAMLKVAAAGSSGDPSGVVVDGKPVAGNALVEALRQQGFTHLFTATKHRNVNVIRLASGVINTGRGQLEGLGFYIDPTIRVQSTTTADSSDGIIAPYLYIELRLVDLATMDVRAQAITANSVFAAFENKKGSDAWGALTAEEKIAALRSLITRHVAQAVPALFPAK